MVAVQKEDAILMKTAVAAEDVISRICKQQKLEIKECPKSPFS